MDFIEKLIEKSTKSKTKKNSEKYSEKNSENKKNFDAEKSTEKKTVCFDDLGLSPELLDAVKSKGFTIPSKIQEKVIPVIYEDTRDVIGQAATGTGKTAAFGLPMLDLLEEKQNFVQALILTPTRELTVQVAKELNSLKGNKRLNIVPIYGGDSIQKQISALRKQVDIVVGTPGRVIDHIQKKRLKLSQVKMVVLDEADEMMTIGFLEEVEEILSATSEDKRMLLFSATMPKSVLRIVDKYMKEYVTVKAKNEAVSESLTKQTYIEVRESDKLEVLYRLIDVEDDFYGLIFCRTKRDVDDVAERLITRGYEAEHLHGDLSQFQRERVLNKLRKRLCRILVVTDVAARGLDIENLSHVINYGIPQNEEAYIHRVGRTGRAGKTGKAITLVNSNECSKLFRFKRNMKHELVKQDVPDATTIISNKQKRIRTQLESVMGGPIDDQYMAFSKEILQDENPVSVLAGILKLSYGEELDQKHYSDLKVNKRTRGKESSGDRRGGDRQSGDRRQRFSSKDDTRLFVAKGRLDQYNPKKLVSFIEKRSNVFGKRIQNVQIYDKFSFVTVTKKDADSILESFEPKNSSERKIVERAKVH